MLPKKIKLLEKEYNIISENSSCKSSELGLIFEHYNQIHIGEYQSKENTHIVLLHELTHALFKQTGHSKYDEDENLIDIIALGIYSLIKHNDFSFMKEEDIVDCKTFNNE